MRKSTATALAVVAGLASMALPVLAALVLAHRQSMGEESSYALALAGEVLRRSEDTGRQAFAAEQRLREAALADPCSAEAIALMRDIDMASPQLQVVGFALGDRLLCSSLGRHGEGIALGPPAYVSSFAATIRRDVDLGIGQGRRFLVVERDGHVAAIHPESLVDVYLDRDDLSLGSLGRSTGQPMARRGSFDPVGQARLRDAAGSEDAEVYFDGRHLVAVRRSRQMDIAAYAAVPVAQLQARLWGFAAVLVPIGLVFGGCLAAACFYLAHRRSSLPGMLRAALRRGEFELRYQPIIDLRSGRIAGAEALLRWPRGEQDGMPTDMVVAAAERCGLVQRLTGFVIARVAEDAPALLARMPGGYISINLSAADLQDQATVDALDRLVHTPGLPASGLVVEATEHSFLDPERAEAVVRAIRGLGIRVAIDDFGKGYSSLSYLTRLTTDFLKIDRDFIETIGTDSVTSRVALHIILVAESLGLKAVAEGVETEQQAAFLREHGVELAQGWLFARAMPPGALLERLQAQGVAAAPA